MAVSSSRYRTLGSEPIGALACHPDHPFGGRREMANAMMRRREFLGRARRRPPWRRRPRGPGPPPRRGGTLRQVGFEPPTFDIHASVSFQTQLISSFVHRTLFKYVNGSKYGPSTSPSPRHRSEGEVSKDGRVYTITLRRASAGRRSAAQWARAGATDVKYTWDRALKKSGYANLLGRSRRWRRPTSTPSACTWPTPTPPSP